MKIIIGFILGMAFVGIVQAQLNVTSETKTTGRFEKQLSLVAGDVVQISAPGMTAINWTVPQGKVATVILHAFVSVEAAP